MNAADLTTEPYVPESAFGKWFLHSGVWTTRVLEIALQDLETLIPTRQPQYEVVLDVGCGYGRSMKKLHQRFSPKTLIAADIDPEMISATEQEARQNGIEIKTLLGASSSLALPDNSVDLLFCHQTFHHLLNQEKALSEFYRVLKPGGIMLFAESTRRYIHSWMIKLLFRHPMDVQKTADEYLALIRDTGFEVEEQSISYPFLWWSREDLGILENWFGITPTPAPQREETLINLVATKPL